MDATGRWHDYREIAGRVAAIVIALVVIVLLGRTYIGHSHGPYGTCYGSSGRSIPCAVAAKDSGR
jgi:hypothetical protein